jgi:hypothetical protein
MSYYTKTGNHIQTFDCTEDQFLQSVNQRWNQGENIDGVGKVADLERAQTILASSDPASETDDIEVSRLLETNEFEPDVRDQLVDLVDHLRHEQSDPAAL